MYKAGLSWHPSLLHCTILIALNTSRNLGSLTSPPQKNSYKTKSAPMVLCPPVLEGPRAAAVDGEERGTHSVSLTGSRVQHGYHEGWGDFQA